MTDEGVTELTGTEGPVRVQAKSRRPSDTRLGMTKLTPTERSQTEDWTYITTEQTGSSIAVNGEMTEAVRQAWYDKSLSSTALSSADDTA